MIPTVLVASNHDDVVNAYYDAIARHAVIGCWISPFDDPHVSWVCYRTDLGTFVRLMHFPLVSS